VISTFLTLILGATVACGWGKNHAETRRFFSEHCLFIKKGRLEKSSSSPAELLAAYSRVAPGTPLVIHFHGGLVSAASAKQEALDLSANCYTGRSFPIFFIWNADFWTQLSNLLEAKYRNAAFVQGHLSTAQFLTKLYHNYQSGAPENSVSVLHVYRRYMNSDPQFQRALREQVATQAKQSARQAANSARKWTRTSTWLQLKDDLQNRVTTYFTPYIEGAARYHDRASVSWGGDLLEYIASNLGGRDIWQEMKQETATSFAPGNPSGAGRQFLLALRAHPPARIILVGHSTGCIYILNFLRAARTLLPGRRFDVIFLAPANTYSDMADYLTSGPNQIQNFRMFAMRDDVERRDHMMWQINPQLSGLYPASVLYFVSRAVERKHNAPLLGLQRDYSPSAVGIEWDENALVRRSLLDYPRRVVWAPCEGPDGQCSACTDHGDFCSDPKTLKSLRMLITSSAW
jgi:hypothetical protein